MVDEHEHLNGIFVSIIRHFGPYPAACSIENSKISQALIDSFRFAYRRRRAAEEDAGDDGDPATNG